MAVVISSNMYMTVQPAGGLNKPILGWESILSSGTFTAEYDNEDYPVVNLTNISTASKWRSTSDATQYIRWDSIGVSTVNYIGIARHNFASIDATITVIGYLEDEPHVLAEPMKPASDSPILWRFPEIAVDRIDIIITTPDDIPEMAVLYAGILTVMSGGLYQEVTPIPYSYDTSIVTSRAESGDFLGRIITDQRMRATYEFAYVEYDWFREHMGRFIKGALERPFFFAWLPEQYPDDVMFGWLEGDINPTAERFEDAVVVRFEMNMAGIAV